MIGKIWAWLHSKDWLTWIGHGLQGLAIVAVADVSGLGVGAGVFAVSVHFGLREGPGLVIAAVGGDTAKLRDGLGDLWAPFVGVGLWVLVKSFGL